ncbi:lysine transporter [Citrobacter koseri]|uniref:Lysine transporter n=1 Tax=Citrobacter koseri TaxID=545 RepID=A0A447UHX0_CITKO|nr:lysine transporter [Citrobacter koseri]
MLQGNDVKDLPYRSGFFPLGPIFAFVLCLTITLGQNYEAFLKDTIDWGGVAATYIGIPLFLAIWFGYKLTKGTHFVRYSEMHFPERGEEITWCLMAFALIRPTGATFVGRIRRFTPPSGR